MQIDEVAIALLCDPGIREQGRRARAPIPTGWSISTSTPSTRRSPAARPTWWSACTCAAATSRATISAKAATSSVAERFFAGIRVNHFLLEYDTPRAGDFEPLRFVPKSKGVVLGLVSSKTPELESRDGVQRRVEDAAKYIDLDRLAISPQCGFASTVAGNPLTEADERAKLRLVVEVARATWR